MRFLHLLGKPGGNSASWWAASFIHLGTDTSKFVFKAENTPKKPLLLLFMSLHLNVAFVSKPNLTHWSRLFSRYNGTALTLQFGRWFTPQTLNTRLVSSLPNQPSVCSHVVALSWAQSQFMIVTVARCYVHMSCKSDCELSCQSVPCVSGRVRMSLWSVLSDCRINITWSEMGV